MGTTVYTQALLRKHRRALSGSPNPFTTAVSIILCTCCLRPSACFLARSWVGIAQSGLASVYHKFGSPTDGLTHHSYPPLYYSTLPLQQSQLDLPVTSTSINSTSTMTKSSSTSNTQSSSGSGSGGGSSGGGYSYNSSGTNSRVVSCVLRNTLRYADVYRSRATTIAPVTMALALPTRTPTTTPTRTARTTTATRT
jgi:uncharacterized membrane protein YgcG